MLPKSKSEYGYTDEEVKSICKKRGIKTRAFNKAFGVNTCALVNGKVLYYKCDVERALYELRAKDGKFHMWD